MREGGSKRGQWQEEAARAVVSDSHSEMVREGTVRVVAREGGSKMMREGGGERGSSKGGGQ